MSLLVKLIADIRNTQTDPDLLVMADWLEEKGGGLEHSLRRVARADASDMFDATPKLIVELPARLSFNGTETTHASFDEVVVRSFEPSLISVVSARAGRFNHDFHRW